MAGRRTSDADTDSAGLERRTFTGEPEETGKDTTEEQPSGFLRPDWKEFQLNPLFVAEMMGFPPDWTVSPFLGEDRHPLKDTGTLSSPR